MKKPYSHPEARVEEFVANEYVAICWTLECNIDAANTIEKSWMISSSSGNNSGGPGGGGPGGGGPNGGGPNGGGSNSISNYDAGQYHTADGCGATATYSCVLSGDRIIDLTEGGNEGLSCTFYTDATYKTSLPSVSVNSSILYWTTSIGSRVWHHQGTPKYDSSHANHS